MKCHGSSDVKAVKNAVRQARIAVQVKLVQSIAAEINGK
jgi:glycerol-3-phosphate acyltransferase PlsX